MAKKIFIVLGVLILIIITLSLFSSYKSYKISKEKCGEISRQQGRQFVYIEGAGCVAKEILEMEKKYGPKGAYLVQVDKSFSTNMKGMIVNEIENYKKEKGSYSGFTTNINFSIDNEFCTSKITILVSPDGNKYAMYIPFCSDKEKIFCLDSTDNTTVKELPKNNITSIEQSYSCK